jgi:catalase
MIPSLSQCFATHNYFGINAFEFTNSQEEKNYVRYQILPVNGQELLSADEVAKVTPNYLFEELPKRLKKGEAKFRLLAQIAAKNDVVNDPTVIWPNDRKLIELGVISLEAPVADNVAAEKALAFNPLILLDGIAP